MSILKHLKNITPKNVHAYLQAQYRILNEENLPLHIKEQILWRSIQAKPCTDNKECLYCGCSTEDLELYYADIGCKRPDNPCYPAMMNEEDWNKYKQTNVLQKKTSRS